MSVMEFQVCRRGREARWVVTLGNAVYGAYLDKEQALLDAVDAARDALEAGREAQVWVRDQRRSPGILRFCLNASRRASHPVRARLSVTGYM